MQNPLEITFHDMHQNATIETIIQEKFEKIKTISPDVTKCHVSLEKLSKHHQSGNTSCARLDLKVPHFEDIFINEKCVEGEGPLITAVNKIFKRGQILLREEIKRRQDSHRVARPGKYSVEEKIEEDDEDFDLT